MARVSTVRLSQEGVIEVQCADDHWRREIRRSASMIAARLVPLLGAEVIKQVKVPGASRGRKRK